MSNSLYKLFCNSEGKVVRVWGSTPPTTCPNNNTHDIALDSIREDHQFNNKIITEENTTGDFETEDITMEIPQGVPGEVSEHDVTWPMDFLLWKTILKPSSEMIGDLITVLAIPETTVGAIVAPINIGDTTFYVDPGIFNYIKRGYVITLDDTTNKEFLGRITHIDSVSGTITTENATAYGYNPGTPVKMSIYVIKNLYMSDTDPIEIASKGIKGKSIQSGGILRVYYTNNSGTYKMFRWRTEGYNDG